MLSKIYHYCPVTTSAFLSISDYSERNVIVIRKEDSFFLNQRKRVEIFAKKTVVACAYLVAAVATPVLLVMDVGVHILGKAGIHLIKPYFADFHYFYTSNLYDVHFDQFKKFIETYVQEKGEKLGYQGKTPHETNSFSNKGLALIDSILHPPSLHNEASKRTFHQKLLEQLRELVSQKKEPLDSPQAKEMAQFIEDLCEWIYTGPKLMPEMIQFMESLLSAEEIQQLMKANQKELPTVISQFYQRLSENPRLSGIDESTRLYDPRYLGDLPSFFYSYKVQSQDKMSCKKVKVIRTPNVAKDVERDHSGKLLQVEIVEEFRGFLDSYQKNKKIHVYFNLMQRGGSEGIRSRAIEDLETEYPEAIHVITLTRDFDFYRQKGNFVNLNNGDDFKKRFIEEMFNKNGADSHFHWSPALGSNWQEECSKLLDTVHAKYFKDKAELTREERLDFIEITYTEIIEMIVSKLQPDSMNDSCKSCIDRGAAALAEQYIKRNQAQTNMSDSKRKKLMTIALAPAILAMNRVMQKERMERFQTAAQRLILA